MLRFSPQGRWTTVESILVQQRLQAVFEQWGLPDSIRFDNGKPWGQPTQRIPTCLALWLVGLGIQPIFGRPRQSTDNAVVERSHGVLTPWVEPETCATWVELQQRLDEFVHIQREVYPACANGLSRLMTFPDLCVPRRPYRRQDDEQLWQLLLVYEYVAQLRCTRTVEKNGRITHFTAEYFVGRSYAAQQVTVYLNLDTGEWITEDRQGAIIKRFQAEQLNYLTIVNHEMVYRKG